MKLIIAGGTGLIGRLLVSRLLEEDHQVWVLSRNPGKAKFPTQVRVVKWDGKTSAGWQPLVEQADAIINLTGENLGASRWTKRRMALLRSSRIEPAQAILQAIREASHRPTVLLQSSAVGYYGIAEDQVLDEKSSPGLDRLSQLVVEWENAIQPVDELGVRRIIARQGIVLDDREGALPRMLLPFRLFVGGPVGGGKQWISWISRRDIVDGMLFLLKSENAGGVYNLTAPQPLTNAEFGKTIAEVLRRPYWMPVPAFFLRLLFGEMATVVLEGQRVFPARLLEAGYSFHHASLRPALEDLFGR
ncbi:TIGR01777 family protein [Longilinea arvoryzae]|uniref:TIGR01777 family protein n=1 Tax=Longilinea arvoryzae TaxID=360412 RepID=A0A0S7BBS7_9CHLR|nr:TIGR01777 family oxidoreductase [Longilinea arvoryzae]GAP15134.1 TIGR01777 family protein [Longilinea arvoryzae]